ncbi:MAG TPA: JAB domain-containing protein [Myxococcota bacterium]
MATYVETPERLIVPNRRAEWRIEYDPAKRIPLLASRRVVVLMRAMKRRKRIVIRGSDDVGDMLGASALNDREAVYLLLLDAKQRVMGVYVVGLGGPSSSVVDLTTLMRVVLATDPTGGVILVHNHPSGDQIASPEDVMLTERLVRAVDFFGYTLLDHVVIAGGGYFSFAESGLLSD